MKDNEDPHNVESDEIQRLLRLKRYETPGEDYFVRFAEAFKDRQRSEMLRGSARSLLVERVTQWFDEINPIPSHRWAVPATAVAALLAVGFFFTTQLGSQPSGGDAFATTETEVNADTPQYTLPNFKASSEEDIVEFSIPRLSTRPPALNSSHGGQTLNAGGAIRLREL